MYVLYADNLDELRLRSRRFDEAMEPYLKQLDAYQASHSDHTTVPEIEQYLQVCRWPFRKLEYSFVLEALQERLLPGQRYLDAGCGITPLAHVVAGSGIEADACDGDERLIADIQRLGTDKLYGSRVNYRAEDLTALSYPDQSFDAVSCVSVLEHIPAPYDQVAVRELMRVLKPGGLLVITVDYTPPAAHDQPARVPYALRRLYGLAREGNFVDIARGIARKLQAGQAVRQGLAQRPRSANQCFTIDHLSLDIQPLLEGVHLNSRLPFSQEPNAVSPEQATRFWRIDGDLFDHQGRRVVLPAGFIVQKAGVAQSVPEQRAASPV